MSAAMAGNGLRQAIHITLRGRYNLTYSGTLILHGNLTSRLGDVDTDGDPGNNGSLSLDDEEKYDATGASYYVVAVVLVYGMSIVALIASHIKRRHDKIAEDKQIDKYLQDFQIIKEVHARDSYKNLKKSVMRKINWDRKKETHRSIQQSILPLLAIGVQVGSSKNSSMESITDNQPKGKRKVYPVGAKRHSDPDISDISSKFAENNDIRPNRVRRHSHMDQPSCYQGNESSHPALSLLLADAAHVGVMGGVIGVGGGSLDIPEPHLLNVNYGTITSGQVADTANARRLRFSNSVSQLDRSLNSIAEGEEEREYTPPVPPRSSLSLTQSSVDSLIEEDGGVEERDDAERLSHISRLSKLRQIGVPLKPTDEPPTVSSHISNPYSQFSYDGQPSFTYDVEDVEGSNIQIPVTCPDVMVADDIWMMEMKPARSPPPTPRRSFSITPRSLSVVPQIQSQLEEEEEEEVLTPGTLLNTIKNSNPALTRSKSLVTPRSRSHSLFYNSRRSSSRSPILGRRSSKDRQRSSSIDQDRTIEIVEDNPLQITCV